MKTLIIHLKHTDKNINAERRRNMMTIEEKKYLEDWYKQYYQYMYNRAYSMLKDEHMAKDVVNDAFIRVMNHVERVKSLSLTSRAYYFKCTVSNVAIDYQRKRKMEQTFAETYGDSYMRNISIGRLSILPEMILESEETIDTIRKFMEHLEERDQMLVFYKYMLEYSNKEIAELMDIPLDQVTTYIGRAKKRLIKMLNEEVDKSGEK